MKSPKLKGDIWPLPPTFREIALEHLKKYKEASCGDEREAVLRHLASCDLAVLEALIQIIIEQHHWINDAKEMLQRG